MKSRTILLLISIFASCAARAECNVSVSESFVDYGRISASAISHHRGDINTLDEREVRVNAICSEPQLMALFIADDVGLKGFQFGDYGNVLISAQQGILDGRSVDLGKTLIHGSFRPKRARNRRNILLLNNDGLLPIRNGDVPVGQQFSFLLHIRPVLKPRERSAHDEENLRTTLRIQIESQ